MSKAFVMPAAVSLCLFSSGCSRNPNVEILGSYFPGWMLSLVLGIALTGLTHALLRGQGLLHWVGHPAVIYPAMVILFTCLLWLGFFA